MERTCCFTTLEVVHHPFLLCLNFACPFVNRPFLLVSSQILQLEYSTCFFLDLWLIHLMKVNRMRSEVWNDDYSWWNCIAELKFGKRIELTCSYTQKKVNRRYNSIFMYGIYFNYTSKCPRSPFSSNSVWVFSPSLPSETETLTTCVCTQIALLVSLWCKWLV